MSPPRTCRRRPGQGGVAFATAVDVDVVDDLYDMPPP
jgi:hypothetical protein